MDLREKLILWIQDSVGGCARHWAEVIADGLIEKGVTVQDVPDTNVGKWIPVTERLPEDDLSKGSTAKQIKVIVAYKRSNCSWVIRTQLRQKGRWYGRPNEWDWSVSDPISYWMPLPEPPKES